MFECIFLNVFWINYVEWCYFWGNLFELGDCSGMFWKILQRTCHRLNWSETGYVVALLWRDGNGMESHKTAMEENEQTECFGMENNFFGWKFMMELTCLKWRAVFGISAMMCWVTLLTSNPGPMTVTANFPRFCGLLWSFVLGNAPHVGSTSTYQLGTTLLNGPTLRHVVADLDPHLICRRRPQLGSTLAQLRPNVSSWLQLGPELRPAWHSLGPSGVRVCPFGDRSAPSWVQHGPILPTQSKILKAIFLSLFPTFVFCGTHTHTKFRHVRPNMHQDMPKLRRLGPKGRSSWSQVVQIGPQLGLSGAQVGACSASLPFK